MSKLILSIVTPEKEVIRREEIDEVYIPGVLGEFGILPQHTPLFSLLSVGKLTVVSGSQKRYFVLNGGFVEVSNDQVTVLTETCERAEDIDLNRARKALEDSEQA